MGAKEPALEILRVARAANAPLIGTGKVRERLLTPALLIDLDVLDANIAKLGKSSYGAYLRRLLTESPQA